LLREISEIVEAIQEKQEHGRVRRLAEASSNNSDIIQLQTRIKSIFENLQVSRPIESLRFRLTV
jgi:hypothetical protein